MKVLLCHNYYQLRGGEDVSFEAEAELLEAHGHRVIRYTVHNDAVNGLNPITVAGRTFWSRQTRRELGGLIARERPDVMHCTNTFPLLSPAAYDAARAHGVAIVQALHNYRLLCPNGQLMRDGRVCEACVGRVFAWPGVRHACYRGSVAASAVVAGTTALHRLAGTWSRKVDLYYTPSAFARQRFIDAGMPADRIGVKPNFLDPDPGDGRGEGGYAVFVGRLSPEKGIDTMLTAWTAIGRRVPLKIVGGGPLADRVAAAAEASGGAIEWLGERSVSQVLEVLSDAACLVMPSVWYETFGRTIMEAFARGTPAIVSNLGAMAELVEDGENGLHFPAGDAAELAGRVLRVADDPALRAKLRHGARASYLARYTGAQNYPQLIALYRRAMQRHGVLRHEALQGVGGDVPTT